MININGKNYKHISDLKKSRNTLKQYIWRVGAETLPVLKLRGGYYIEVDEDGKPKI